MITIAEALETLIKESIYLEDAITKNLINYSALARELKPEVESITKKEVKESALIMALNRRAKTYTTQNPINNMFKTMPNMIVRSNLFELTIANSKTLVEKQRQILEQVNNHNDTFITITSGVFETTIIASSQIKSVIESSLKDEEKIALIDDLASITLQLTEEIVITPGSYSSVLKTLAWKNINVIEVVSTYHELTLILKNKDADKAFSALKQKFTPFTV